MQDETTRVALVGMNSVMADPAANLARVAHWCQEASAAGARFVLFPEECITGSMNKSDLSFQEARKIAVEAAEKSVPILESLCRELQMTVVVGTIGPGDGGLRNNALIVGPEGYLTTYSKLHLPNEKEREWFEPGETLPIVSSQNWSFSVGICYDLRVAEIFRAAASSEVDFFMLAVGSSYPPHEIGRAAELSEEHKQLSMKILPARAVDNGIYVFFANQAGVSGNAWFPGLTLAIDPAGNVIGEQLLDEGMVLADVSRRSLSAARSADECTVRRIRPEVYLTPQLVTG
jgi:N-carbamoylputrescine amidase